jgi:hypothetical protein
VNKTGLAAGHYVTVIEVKGAIGSRTQDSPQQIQVDLWVSQGTGGKSWKTYLPLIRR